MSPDALSLVALIGRPNVGKSTLFNRLTRRRDAIVDPTPGVTRDRHYSRIEREDCTFDLVDTGGLESNEDQMGRHIRDQATQAINEADIILCLLDGRQGVTPDDWEIVDLLRRTEKKIFFVINKIDGPEQEIMLLSPFWELGVEELWALSADHGHGFSTLMHALEEEIRQVEKVEPLPEETIKLAFVGRPNVGKSSLVNSFMGQDRMVVSDIAGTTRDAVDTLLQTENHHYLLIDTAGIRRKGKTKDKLEKFSILKALKSMARADLCVVVIDAEEGITDQDTKIIGYTQDQGCGCIILLNKWDLLKNDPKAQKRCLEEVELATNFITFAPVLKVSALTGQGIRRIFPLIGKMARQYRQRVPTASLNRLLQDAADAHNPPIYHGRRIKLYYTAQLGTEPPTFVIISNSPKGIHFSYQRYLTNRFREGLGLDMVPVRLLFKERSQRRPPKKKSAK